MKTILLPTHPKYCHLTYGTKEKTEEIRKTAPEPPFKVLSYCTSIKNMNLNDYVTLHKKTNGLIDNWHSKVIGEFVVDKVTEIPPCTEHNGIHYPLLRRPELSELVKRACLSFDELYLYGVKKKNGCYGASSKVVQLLALHITAPKLYDRPRELGEFYRRLPETILEGGDYDCRRPWNCTCPDAPEGSEYCQDCVYGGLVQITRAPQSWVYIQDPEEV